LSPGAGNVDVGFLSDVGCGYNSSNPMSPSDLDRITIALSKLIQDKYVDAEPIYQRSLAITEQALGPDHPDVASLDSVANMLQAQARVGGFRRRRFVIKLENIFPTMPRKKTLPYPPVANTTQ